MSGLVKRNYSVPFLVVFCVLCCAPIVVQPVSALNSSKTHVYTVTDPGGDQSYTLTTYSYGGSAGIISVTAVQSNTNLAPGFILTNTGTPQVYSTAYPQWKYVVAKFTLWTRDDGEAYMYITLKTNIMYDGNMWTFSDSYTEVYA